MSLKLGKNKLMRLINKELLTLIEEPRGSDTAKLECAKKRRTVYPSLLFKADFDLVLISTMECNLIH